MVGWRDGGRVSVSMKRSATLHHGGAARGAQGETLQGEHRRCKLPYKEHTLCKVPYRGAATAMDLQTVEQCTEETKEVGVYG